MANDVKDSPWLARAGILLVFSALVTKCVALTLQIILGRQLHSSGSADQSFIDQVDSLSSFANGALLITGAGATVAFISWFYGSYRNLATIGAAIHPPFWAALSWFVPVLNLFRPPEIMGELTNQFSPGRRPKKARWTGQLVTWWLSLVAGFGTHLFLRLSDPITIRHWIFWETAALLANGMLMVSLIALWGLVQRAAVKQAGMRATAPRLRQGIDQAGGEARVRELHSSS